MQEYVTKSFVLRVEPAGESDLRIHLYTELHGRIVALARAARKQKGRLAGHLQPLGYVQVRIVERKGAQIVDALSLRGVRPEKTIQERMAELGVADLIMKMTTIGHSDRDLWQALRLRGFTSAAVLKALGFDAAHARCAHCGASAPKHFVIASAEYICDPCLHRYAREREVVLQ